MNNQTVLIVMLALISVVMIGMYIQYTSAPNVVGCSISHAKEVITESGKSYVLGNKIGFVQPRRGDYNLLGKIAEQVVVYSNSSSEPHVIDYKLYQLDIDEIASIFKPPQTNEQKAIQPTPQQPTVNQQQLEEQERLKKIQAEQHQLHMMQQEKERVRIELEEIRKEQERLRMEQEEERIHKEQREQESIRKEQEEQIRKQKEQDKHKKKRTNPLQFSIPEQESEVKYHVAKKSFFW